MFSDIMQKLKARVIKDAPREKYSTDFIEIELGVKFSDEYSALLNHYDGSIVFDNGAIYRPLQLSPVDNKHGFQILEILYGLSGESNLLKRNQMYHDQIPAEYVVIGESVGGNQICLSKQNEKVYFWHHEALTDDTSLFEIAADINSFILSLEKDDKDHNNDSKREIDESGSFLDF